MPYANNIGSIIHTLAKSKTSRLLGAEQISSSLTLSQTTKTGFLVTWLSYVTYQVFACGIREQTTERDDGRKTGKV